MKDALRAVVLALGITAAFASQATACFSERDLLAANIPQSDAPWLVTPSDVTGAAEMPRDASLGIGPALFAPALSDLDPYLEPLLQGGVTAASFMDTWSQGLFALAYLQGNEARSSGWGAASPQPKTYALVFAGLGLLGFIANRRRKAPGMSYR